MRAVRKWGAGRLGPKRPIKAVPCDDSYTFIPHVFNEMVLDSENTAWKRQRQSCLPVTPQKATDRVWAWVHTVLVITALW